MSLKCVLLSSSTLDIGGYKSIKIYFFLTFLSISATLISGLLPNCPVFSLIFQESRKQRKLFYFMIPKDLEHLVFSYHYLL